MLACLIQSAAFAGRLSHRKDGLMKTAQAIEIVAGRDAGPEAMTRYVPKPSSIGGRVGPPILDGSYTRWVRGRVGPGTHSKKPW